MSYRILCYLLLVIFFTPTLYASSSSLGDASLSDPPLSDDESTVASVSASSSLSTSSSEGEGGRVVLDVRDGKETRTPVTRFQSTHELPAAIATLYTDVPGREDDCLRFSICFWRLSGNLFNTLSIAASLGSGLCSTLIAIPGLLNDTEKEDLSVVAALLAAGSATSAGVAIYAKRAVVDRREDLRQLLADHGIDVPADDADGGGCEHQSA